MAASDPDGGATQTIERRETKLSEKRLAAAVAALIVVAVAMTAGLASARPTASLSGAGSTFVVPLVTAAAKYSNRVSFPTGTEDLP